HCLLFRQQSQRKGPQRQSGLPPPGKPQTAEHSESHQEFRTPCYVGNNLRMERMDRKQPCCCERRLAGKPQLSCQQIQEACHDQMQADIDEVITKGLQTSDEVIKGV